MDLVERGRSSSLSIRPAVGDDYQEILSVWTLSGLDVRLDGRDSEASYRRQVQRYPDLYLVACSGDRIAGVVFGSHDHRKGWINRLAVLPEFRRRGLASALVDACEEAIRACGIEIIAALVEPENEESATLFEKLGYRADVPARYYRKLSRPEA